MSAAPITSNIYTQLDAAKRQIRLLRIVPTGNRDTRDNELDCQLTTVSLDEGVEFDALSYAWGNPNDRVPIQLNGFEFFVTINLHDALKSFRDDHGVSGYLWADAICVNQSDLAERSQQVSIMGPIFRKARKVDIWLGLEGEHSIETTETLVRMLSDGFNVPLSQIGKNVLDGLEDLLLRSWWSRVWVIHEAVAATEPVVHLGKTQIPFRGLLKILREFVMKIFSTESAELSDERQTKLHVLCDRIFDVYNSFNIKDLSSENSSTILEVLRLLNGGGRGQATDPRDHVYALLGILPSSIEIRPDYTSSVESLYKDATMKLMTWSKSLAPLCRRADNESNNFPTWVADLRCCSFQAYIYQGFNSSLELPALIEERVEGQLYVHAKVIDYVEGFGDRCPEVTSISGLGEDSFEEFRRVLNSWRALAAFKTTPHLHIDLINQSFWRTVVHNSVIDSGGKSQPYSASALGVSEIEDWLSNGTTKTNEETYRRLRMVWVQNVDHVFFTTRNELYGVSQGSPLHNDAIALLAGSKCPFILRPMSQGARTCYRVVGACYCDGVMYGEAVSISHSSESSTIALDCGFEEIVVI